METRLTWERGGGPRVVAYMVAAIARGSPRRTGFEPALLWYETSEACFGVGWLQNPGSCLSSAFIAADRLRVNKLSLCHVGKLANP
jgi:hypothetical protein